MMGETVNYTRTKVGTFKVGMAVTFPTTYNGTHTGEIVAIATKGNGGLGQFADDDKMRVTVRYDDGSTATVETSANYEGWIIAEDVTVEIVAAIIGEDVRDVVVERQGVTVDGVRVAVVHDKGDRVFCYGVEWTDDEPYGPGSGVMCYYILDGNCDQWFDAMTGA